VKNAFRHPTDSSYFSLARERAVTSRNLLTAIFHKIPNPKSHASRFKRAHGNARERAQRCFASLQSIYTVERFSRCQIIPINKTNIKERGGRREDRNEKYISIRSRRKPRAPTKSQSLHRYYPNPGIIYVTSSSSVSRRDSARGLTRTLIIFLLAKRRRRERDRERKREGKTERNAHLSYRA